jgi:hypothetical protein
MCITIKPNYNAVVGVLQMNSVKCYNEVLLSVFIVFGAMIIQYYISINAILKGITGRRNCSTYYLCQCMTSMCQEHATNTSKVMTLLINYSIN